MNIESTTSNKMIHVICNTHWDREWRFSFQQSRMMLVRMMDGLLELMAKHPDFSYYHLDSHVIMLDDYLQIRPEKRAEVSQLVRDGRLLIGPWYTLPDATMTDGEGLIRNLLWGNRKAMEYGKVMDVGYTPNGFGQVSQTPQIYRGFGLDEVMFYRGINREQAPDAEFIWQGPDGSKLLAFRFGQFSRYNFHYLLYRPVLKNRFFREGGKYNWSDGGVPFHPADLDARYKEYWLLEPTEPINYDNLPRALDEFLQELSEGTTTQALGMAGDDQCGPNPLIPDLVNRMSQLHEGVDGKMSSLPEYMKAFAAEVDETKLAVVKGEMRHSSMNGLMTDLYWGIIAARSYLKIEAFKQEMLYFRWAEPFSAFAALLGKEYPKSFLDLSLDFLLQNQAHDSIGGCALDKIHQDVMHRYSEANEISNVLTREAIAHILQQVNAGDKSDILLAVFNPCPFPRSEVITAAVEVPRNAENVRVSISSLDGKQMLLQDSFRESGDLMVQQPTDVPIPFYTDRFLVHFEAEDIPAFGYKVFKITPETTKKHISGSLLVATNSAENEHLIITIDMDGSLVIEDKVSGAMYANGLTFEDSGDVGDPWVRKTPLDNPIMFSTGQPVHISIKEAGNALVSFLIEQDMLVPESASQDLKSRSKTMVPLHISSTVTLRKGARRVDIVTTVNNTAKDHRLRVLFPTFIPADQSSAGSQCDVVSRPISLPDTSDWVEPMPHTHPHRHFFDISDCEDGLAIFSEGLMEYEVSDNDSKTMSLTLIRAFQQRNSVRGIEYPDQRDSQCLGETVFRYSIYPHQGQWHQGGVPQQAQAHNLPLKSFQFGSSGHGKLPTSGSFISISPAEITLSGIKQSEDGKSMIVRFFNPLETAVEAEITSMFTITAAQLLNMAETEAEATAILDNKITLEAGAKKIITLALSLKK